MPNRGRGRGRGRGAGAGASAGADAVPSLPEELVGSIMAQLTSAALTTDEHELHPRPVGKHANTSDPVQARLIQLVTCTQVCKAWQRQAATSLADQRFWEQLCSNRWHDAVPPTPDYRLHYVKRRAMEKHKAAPDWRDEFHLLLDVRWNNRKQPLWPGQTPGDSKFLVRSLSLRDAIIDEVDGIPANATWYIPGIHIDDELDMGVRSGGSPLSLGSCVLHERGERMLEVVPDRRTKTTKQAYTKYRSGHWSLQLHHEAPRLAELSTIKLGMHSWCPVQEQEDGPDCEGIGIQSHIQIEIPSTACKDNPDYVETDHAYCTEVTLTFTAEVLTGMSSQMDLYGYNWIKVDEWPELFRFLPWK